MMVGCVFTHAPTDFCSNRRWLKAVHDPDLINEGCKVKHILPGAAF